MIPDTIDLDAIINEKYNMGDFLNKREVKELMTEAIRQALEIAANEAELEYDDYFGEMVASVDKQSILNVINRIK